MVQLDGGTGGDGGGADDSDSDLDASAIRQRSTGEMGDMIGVQVEEQSQPEPEPTPSPSRNRGGKGSQPEPEPEPSPQPSPSSSTSGSSAAGGGQNQSRSQPSPSGTSATVSTGGRPSQQPAQSEPTPDKKADTDTASETEDAKQTDSADESFTAEEVTEAAKQRLKEGTAGATTERAAQQAANQAAPEQTQDLREQAAEQTGVDPSQVTVEKVGDQLVASLSESGQKDVAARQQEQRAQQGQRIDVEQAKEIADQSRSGGAGAAIDVQDVQQFTKQREAAARQQAVADARTSGAAAAASSIPNKIERQLEAEVGTDLDPGEDFILRQTEEGGFQAQLTAEGRIKAAGVQETGQTFLDRQIEQFEASTGIDFIPGEGDVVQQTEAELARAAQVQREGRGLLPSAEQAERFITVGDDQVLAPLAPSQVVDRESPAGQQSVGQARRLAQIANPAAIALGAGKLGEAGGEFAFNVAGAAVPASATLEAAGAGGRGPASRRRDTSGLEAAAAFEQRREEQRAAQIATAKETLRKLRTESVEAVRERPFQTAGSAATELGVAAASAAVSPVRVSSTTVPLRSGGSTTARALRIEPPPLLSGTTRRTGVSVVGTKGLRPTRGAPSFDLEDVDFARLGSRAGDTFEPVGVLETEVFTKSARRFGGEVGERTSAIGSVVDVGDRPRTRRGLELTKTEDILRRARAVPERKAPELAEELADLDATIKGSAAVKAQVPEARQPRDIDLIVADEGEARSRLGAVLEDTDADVGDVFDFANVDEFAGRGDIVKRGVKGRSPLRTEEGVGVNPLEEELVRKAGASGFFRGPGAAGTLDIDVGPEPRRPGRADVRRKDVADTSAIARGFLQSEFAETPIVRPFKRRRLRRQARDVEAFEQSFAGDFEFPEESILPGRGGVFGDFDTRKLLGEADRGQATLGNFPDFFGGGKRRARRLLNTDISDELDDLAARGSRRSRSPGRRSPSPSVAVPAVGAGFGAGFASSGADVFDSPSIGSPAASGAPAGESPTFGLSSPDTPGVLQSPGLFPSPGGESGAPSPGAPGGGTPSGGPFDSPGEPPVFPSFGIPSGSPSPGIPGPGQPGTPGPSPTPTPGDLGIPTPFKRPDDDERRKKKDEEDILGGFAETQFTFDIKRASSLLGFEGKGPNVFEGFDPVVTGGGELFGGGDFTGFGPSGSTGPLPNPEDISIL